MLLIFLCYRLRRTFEKYLTHQTNLSILALRRFDPHFNAITGLNGSGKSNILDAICFVLGITNLSQVRAGNLSELVYKQGQAGVNKASVTIVFNNQEEATSPVGYEQCPEVTVTRQVLLGGKSKYLINGRNAPAGQVTNLFHSVQLNVNNPHFLIMQGTTPLCSMRFEVFPFDLCSNLFSFPPRRTYHEGSQHEAKRDLGYGRGSCRYADV